MILHLILNSITQAVMPLISTSSTTNEALKRLMRSMLAVPAHVMQLKEDLCNASVFQLLSKMEDTT